MLKRPERVRSLVAMCSVVTALSACQNQSPTTIASPTQLRDNQSLDPTPAKPYVVYCQNGVPVGRDDGPWAPPGENYWDHFGGTSTTGCPGAPSPSPSPILNGDFIIYVDENKEQGAIVDNIIPEIRIELPGNRSEYQGTESIKIEFSKRSDGIVPEMSGSSEFLTLDSENIARYKVPFSQETVLFPGDQTVTVTLTKKSGAKLQRTLSFSVGARTLYAGLPPSDTAYRVLSAGAEVYKPEKVTELQSQGVRVLTFKGPEFTRGFYTSRSVPPGNSAVFIAYIAGKAIFFFYDGSYESIKNYITRGYDEVDTKKEVGKIRIPLELFQGEGGTREPVSNQTVHDAAVAYKTNTNSRDSEVELWSQTSNRSHLLVYRGEDIVGNVSLGRNKLYHIFLAENQTKVQLAAKVDVPGVWGHVANKNIWPTPEELNFTQRQWADTAKQVLSFTPDYDNRKRYRFGWNIAPEYPYHKFGSIEDTNYKPYRWDRSVTLKDTSSVPEGAVYNPDKVIGGIAPGFNDSTKLHISYNTHRYEFIRFHPEIPFLDIDNPTQEQSQANKDAYLHLANRFIKGYTQHSANSSESPLKNYDCWYSPNIGQIMVYQQSTNQAGYLFKNGKIITYFRPEERAKYISRVVSRDGYRKVDTE